LVENLNVSGLRLSRIAMAGRGFADQMIAHGRARCGAADCYHEPKTNIRPQACRFALIDLKLGVIIRLREPACNAVAGRG